MHTGLLLKKIQTPFIVVIQAIMLMQSGNIVMALETTLL